MSEDSSNRSPKTLADVSHLFFSGAGAGAGSGSNDAGTEEGAAAAAEFDREPRTLLALDEARGAEPEVSDGHETEPERPTRVVVITGGDCRPGKSTVAVNIAEALTSRGRTVLCDADPRIPNARFYLGLPSWNYLSPLTGGGEPAPNVLADGGLLVVDGTEGLLNRCDTGPEGVLSVELPCGESTAVDLLVVDAPIASARTCMKEIGLPADFVVVASPREEGFLEAYGALANLSREVRLTAAALVVNRAPSTSYARAFHAKMQVVAERLLSMELPFLGAVVHEPGLGALQRERGVMVRSRPDATSALLLREIASNALALKGDTTSFTGGPAAPA